MVLLHLIHHHLVTVSSLVSNTQIQVPPGLPQTSADNNTVQRILDIALNIIGALALLMITVSGFRYILAAGDSEKVSKAKNGIIYGLVGVVVAIFAEAIVAFVVNRL